MSKRTNTQHANIKKYLEDGNAITPIDALNMFGCFRLSAVIFNLKAQGLDITTEIIKDGDKRYASYSLESVEVA